MENQIKNLRKSRGISQQKFADDIGVSLRTLQRYEKGETENLCFFVKIAEYFDVELEELIGNKEKNIDKNSKCVTNSSLRTTGEKAL